MLDPDIREAMEDRARMAAAKQHPLEAGMNAADAHAQQQALERRAAETGIKIVIEYDPHGPDHVDVSTEWTTALRSICPPPTLGQIALAAKAAHALLGTQPGELVLTDVGNRTVRLSRDTNLVRRF